MNICCIGAGYVGASTMAIIATKCPDASVTVVDVDASRISEWRRGDVQVFEPGLKELLSEACVRNLQFSTDVAGCIQSAGIVFIAVNTPTRTYGAGAGRTVDLSFIEAAARSIAENARRDIIIVEKSTIPVGTAACISSILASNIRSFRFEVLSNPEFLAEGTAVSDLLNPDRILIGGERTSSGQKAVEVLSNIYARWVPRERIITANLWSSELSKLVANAFLAQRISSINSISALCDATGADVDEVANAIGLDSRIGSRYLKASVGFGGASFKKDVLQLVYLCETLGLPEVANYWSQVVAINEWQCQCFARHIVEQLFHTVADKKIAVFGFAFKKNTSDIRESAAAKVCRFLLKERAQLSIYDPEVPASVIREKLGGASEISRLVIAGSVYEASEKAHAILILTEWDEFKQLDFVRLHAGMTKPAFLFDGRNIMDLSALREIGFRVRGIGKPA